MKEKETVPSERIQTKQNKTKLTIKPFQIHIAFEKLNKNNNNKKTQRKKKNDIP